ncbi:MAG: GNAT family N-acetyltransferase [Pseudomonadota bacterium]
MAFNVRQAAPADLKPLLAMVDALNAHEGLPAGKLDARRFRSAIFGSTAFVFCDVAETETDEGLGLIGYALSHDCFSSDEGARGLYLADLFVEEAWRREGVGEALLGAVARRAKKRGASQVRWTSATRNFQARRFYRAYDASDETVHAHALFGDAFDELIRKTRSAPRRKT